MQLKSKLNNHNYNYDNILSWSEWNLNKAYKR